QQLPEGEMRKRNILRNNPQKNQSKKVIVTNVLKAGECLVQPYSCQQYAQLAKVNKYNSQYKTVFPSVITDALYAISSAVAPTLPATTLSSVKHDKTPLSL